MNKFILLDDHPITCLGIKIILKNLCGEEIDFFEPKSSKEVIQISTQHHIDLCVLDIKIPGINSFELMKTLLAIKPDIKIVFISMCNEYLFTHSAFIGGAKGYISKSMEFSKIEQAIKSILEDGFYWEEEFIRQIFNPNFRKQLTTLDYVELKTIETKLILKILNGHTNVNIALEQNLIQGIVS